MTNDAATAPPGFGRCAITGKVVAEDELVTINGQRVCAEGKAILIDRLKSGESLPGESEKPTVLRRFGCIFLDWTLIASPFLIFNVVLRDAIHVRFILVGTIALVSRTASIIYFGAMHAARGQTVGKIAGKLKVVNDIDASPITTQTAYVRALAYAGPGLLTGFVAFAGSRALMSMTSMIVMAYLLINVIFALIDSGRQRALHDRIAGTRIVKVG